MAGVFVGSGREKLGHLRHLRRDALQAHVRVAVGGHGERAVPEDLSHDLGQLRYVSDLEFVDEPAPNEPAWIAD